MRQGWLGAALVVRHVVQQRLRRQVEVPQVVVSGLEVPAHLAGFHVDGDDGRAPLVVELGALTAEEVWRCVAGRQVHQTEFGVVGHGRPHVRRATGVSLTGRRTFAGVRITRIPRPHQFTAAHVVGTHHARWFAGGVVVGHAATDDHHVPCDQRGRGLLVVTGLHFAHVGGQVDGALVAELFAGLAGVGIDGDQAGIAGRQKQAFRTGGWLIVRRHRGFGVAQATATLPVGRGALRVELPALGAGVGIQGEDFAVGGAGVDRVTDLQRGVLVFGAGTGALRDIAGAEGPGDLQLVDVAFVDLVQRGKAVAGGGVAPVGPVFLLGTRRDRRNRRFNGGLDHVGRHEHVGHRRYNAHTQNAGQTVGTTPTGRARSADQGRIDQRHHQTDHGEGQHPRDQRPVFEARIPQGPDHGEDQRHTIQPGAQRLATGNQQAGHQHRQAHQQEIPAATQRNQIATATRQAEPDQCNQHTQPRQQPFAAGGSPRIVHVGHFPHL
ncbi:hypothetical protein D3C73_656260 [compost metagenome]